MSCCCCFSLGSAPTYCRPDLKRPALAVRMNKELLLLVSFRRDASFSFIFVTVRPTRAEGFPAHFHLFVSLVNPL
jgi:hypothetical protein